MFNAKYYIYIIFALKLYFHKAIWDIFFESYNYTNYLIVFKNI